MKYPDIHIATLEAHTCEQLTKDLKAVLNLLSGEPAPSELQLAQDQRNELANNGIIFLDTIRDKMNGIRALLTTELSGAE